MVNGNVSNEGRVEIFYNNTWDTICDNYWSISTNDAIVVSRQLVHDPIQAVAYCQVMTSTGLCDIIRRHT